MRDVPLAGLRGEGYPGAAPAPTARDPASCAFFDRSFNRQAFAVRPGEEVSEALRGFDPGTIMTAAFNGINWWCEQAALVQEMSSRRVQEEGRAHAEGSLVLPRICFDCFFEPPSRRGVACCPRCSRDSGVGPGVPTVAPAREVARVRARTGSVP